MRRERISLCLNLLIAVAVLAAWFGMTFSVTDSGALSAGGLNNLKYFTVLSNLLEAASGVLWAGWLARRLRGWTDAPARWLRRLRYAAVTSVALTFTVVMTFLGPLYGYASMFRGASLWLHLIVPVAAVVDFCALDRTGAMPLGDVPFAILPMLVYGVGYATNLLVNGVGTWPDTNDWYGFAMGGVRTIPFVFAVVALATLALALLLRLPRRR